MTQPEPAPLDSAIPWVAEHTRRYVESDGEDGHLWHGVPTLVLTTTGRRSGQPRRNALIYGRDGDDYVIVASRGGDDHDPLWYRNLVDHPEVQVQVGAEHFAAVATVTDAAHKAELWPRMVEIWPAYEQYQAKTSRDIPVVVVHRVVSGGPILVFDGDCGFCTTSARWVRSIWPPSSTARIVPWQLMGSDGMRDAGLTAAEVEAAAWWIDPAGRRFRGHRAIAKSLVEAGGSWAALGRVIDAPLASPAAALAYRLVSRYRHRLPGGTPACKVRA